MPMKSFVNRQDLREQWSLSKCPRSSYLKSTLLSHQAFGLDLSRRSSQLTENVREEARASPVSDPEIESYLFVFSVRGMTSVAN